MKGRGRCGRRKREKFETEEGRLGVPQTGTQVGPDVENNGSQGSQEGEGGGEPCGQIRQVLPSLQLLVEPPAPSGVSVSHGLCESCRRRWNELYLQYNTQTTWLFVI